jgi:hypothetical protein
MRMQRLAAASMLFVSFLGGCATRHVIPEMAQPRGAGIGIEISSGAYGTWIPSLRQVYFVRIEDEGSLFQQGVYISNFINDDRAYFLNARPGTYVAVAVYHRSNVARYTTYFSSELVELTKVTVHENEFVFMGSYVVDHSAGLEGADALQSHYRSVIGLNTSSGDLQYRGALTKRRDDGPSRTEFLLRIKEDFAGSAWAERLK